MPNSDWRWRAQSQIWPDDSAWTPPALSSFSTTSACAPLSAAVSAAHIPPAPDPTHNTPTWRSQIIKTPSGLKFRISRLLREPATFRAAWLAPFVYLELARFDGRRRESGFILRPPGN